MRSPLLAGLWLAVLPGLSIFTSPAWAIDADSRNAALSAITTQDVKDYVGALADDTFEGRESGSRGNRAAGIYIVDHLKQFGLHGGGAKGSFYQNFTGTYHNILGWVEGRDPALKDQVIVISAHYDHVGYGTSRNSFGPTGLIHNGADDNASGVAALLEVAKALGQLPEKSKRSILLAFWDGEEKGLLGSQHWAENPTVPLNRVSIMMNADMVGRLRNERLVMYGVRTSPGLRQLVSQQNDASQLLIDFSWEIKPDSDHYTFFSRRVPFLMMHTGLHGDYHRPSDDADKINTEGLKQIAQLMFNVLVELADAPDLSGFRKQSQQETRSAQLKSEVPMPPLPGRLGIRWDERAAQRGEIVVAGVTAGLPADKAGLKNGDRIVKFAGREVQGIPEFRLSVLTAKNPVPVTIQRPNEAAPQEVTLELTGDPARLGIAWRTDEAEPNCVIVNRVTPGSPADLAGLRVNDRIYRIAGQGFANGETFRQLAMTQTGPVVLETETAGRIRTVAIPPIDAQPNSPVADAPQQEAE